MPYCTQADIENKRVPQETLVNLTDDDGLGVVDTEIVAAAIDDADALIDSYLETRYPLPLATVPVLLGRLSADIASFYLYGRRPEFETPKRIESGHSAALRLLEKIQNGQVSLGAQVAPPTSGPSYTTSGRIFTRDTLKDM